MITIYYDGIDAMAELEGGVRRDMDLGFVDSFIQNYISEGYIINSVRVHLRAGNVVTTLTLYNPKRRSTIYGAGKKANISYSKKPYPYWLRKKRV